jgi:hypothetical protein
MQQSLFITIVSCCSHSKKKHCTNPPDFNKFLNKVNGDDLLNIFDKTLKISDFADDTKTTKNFATFPAARMRTIRIVPPR